jgi:hypothetical protein
MRKFIAAAAASLIVATAAPAFARDTAPSAPSQPSEASAPKAQTRYCVSETPLGSRLPKKTCKTRAQWIADENFDPLAPKR